MPKYYVASGNFQAIVNGTNARQAAVLAFKRLGNESYDLADVTSVSEKSFNSHADQDEWLLTMEILEECGQLPSYHSKQWRQ